MQLHTRLASPCSQVNKMGHAPCLVALPSGASTGSQCHFTACMQAHFNQARLQTLNAMLLLSVLCRSPPASCSQARGQGQLLGLQVSERSSLALPYLSVILSRFHRKRGGVATIVTPTVTKNVARFCINPMVAVCEVAGTIAATSDCGGSDVGAVGAAGQKAGKQKRQQLAPGTNMMQQGVASKAAQPLGGRTTPATVLLVDALDRPAIAALQPALLALANLVALQLDAERPGATAVLGLACVRRSAGSPDVKLQVICCG